MLPVTAHDKNKSPQLMWTKFCFWEDCIHSRFLVSVSNISGQARQMCSQQAQQARHSTG
jgi:hypothetical protein